MKYLFVILVAFSFVFGNCQNGPEKSKKELIIVDLTMNKLKNIHYLVENNIIQIPGLKIVALYNKNEKYDFSQCENYIKDKKIDYIEMRGLDMNIDYDSLFCKNSLTPIFHKLFQESNGILFMGGDDIPPLIYKEPTSLLTEILPYERMYEFSFMFHLTGGMQNKSFKPFLDEKPGYIVTGICLGMQNMNVSSGGSLFQDIPSELYNFHNSEEVTSQPSENVHRNYWNSVSNKEDYAFCNYHPVIFLPNSFFIQKMKLPVNIKPLVLSAHHQSVKIIGLNYFVSATSVDGRVIEAIEHVIYKNVFGVQFHPEYKFIYDNSYTLKIDGKDKKKTAGNVLSLDDKQFNKQFWAYFSKLMNEN